MKVGDIMILCLADRDFLELMDNPQLHLPMRWDGKNFETALFDVLDTYISELRSYYESAQESENHYGISVDIPKISSICSEIKSCVQEYHNGFPARAFLILSQIMSSLIQTPLDMYHKNGTPEMMREDELRLYRIRKVDCGITYSREDIFHVPVSARSMISTCRYSIAGYPSLYLTTSLKLGLEESTESRKKSIAARFKLKRDQQKIDIQVLELGIKPQDFLEQRRPDIENGRIIPHSKLRSQQVRENYLKWYPIIAACSFIRANRSAPFASEYIIPQLLMQWIRTQSKRDRLMGIRYFSCASIRASEMGYDYVFPVNNCDYKGNFCTVLRDAFVLTKPVFLRDYEKDGACEEALNHMVDFDKI